MHRLLWALQIVLGLVFVVFGIQHFVVPAGLPDQLSWMYDLSDTLHYIAGTAEILGGLGLILPGLTRIATWLIPLAAVGLAVTMLGATVWHVGREEYLNIVGNLILVLLLAFVAFGRWRIRPLSTR